MWYTNLDRSFYRFVTIHACDGQTHGQTDRILIARPRLHSMQRGKSKLLLILDANSAIPYYYSTGKETRLQWRAVVTILRTSHTH